MGEFLDTTTHGAPPNLRLAWRDALSSVVAPQRRIHGINQACPPSDPSDRLRLSAACLVDVAVDSIAGALAKLGKTRLQIVALSQVNRPYGSSTR